jgi:hypothetical protein
MPVVCDSDIHPNDHLYQLYVRQTAAKKKEVHGDAGETRPNMVRNREGPDADNPHLRS